MENSEKYKSVEVVEENPYGKDFVSYRTEYITKKDYLKKHASESFYKTIRVCAIISYVLVGFNVLMLPLNPFAIWDICIMLGFTLGVHLAKNKGCAIAILIYSLSNCVLRLLITGIPAGIAWIVIAIIYLVQFGKVTKEYNSIYGV